MHVLHELWIAGHAHFADCSGRRQHSRTSDPVFRSADFAKHDGPLCREGHLSHHRASLYPCRAKAGTVCKIPYRHVIARAGTQHIQKRNGDCHAGVSSPRLHEMKRHLRNLTHVNTYSPRPKLTSQKPANIVRVDKLTCRSRFKTGGARANLSLKSPSDIQQARLRVGRKLANRWLDP